MSIHISQWQTGRTADDVRHEPVGMHLGRARKLCFFFYADREKWLVGHTLLAIAKFYFGRGCCFLRLPLGLQLLMMMDVWTC